MGIGVQQVHFNLSGSEAIDMVLKIGMVYNRARGER